MGCFVFACLLRKNRRTMDATDLRSLLHRLAEEYPEGLRGAQHQDVERIAFHIELVVRRKGTDCALVDVGGGIGLFTVGCAALGLRSTLVDDFADEVHRADADSPLGILVG